jgi:hypothetical protein
LDGEYNGPDGSSAGSSHGYNKPTPEQWKAIRDAARAGSDDFKLGKHWKRKERNRGDETEFQKDRKEGKVTKWKRKGK